jgi:uncharacterized protein
MPRRPARTVPTVLIPGWTGSEPEHWQSWLADELRGAGRTVIVPDLPDLDAPDLATWLPALRAALAGLTDNGYDVAAHSLGAVLWMHHARLGVDEPSRSPTPARVALVAPPAPNTTIAEIAAFFPPPLDIDALRHSAEGTVLVGGEDDPYLPTGIADAYGRPLKMATTVIAGGGHLNVASGYGPWPAMLDWCNRDNLAFIG